MTTENKNQRSPRPKNPGAVFETWLKRKQQQVRDDDIGYFARWVLANMEKGEWVTSESQKLSQPFGGKRLPSDEQLLRTWRHHLVAYHGLNDRELGVFISAFDEYRRARDDYRRSLGQS